MDEISADYKPKWGVSYDHTFSEGSCDIHRARGEFTITIQQLCYRMRSYRISANNYSGMIGFSNRVLPVIEKAAEKKLEIRNLVLGTHQTDKTNQMNLFFSDEEEHVGRFKAIDEIKKRFITKASAMNRVEGNTHFLERDT